MVYEGYLARVKVVPDSKWFDPKEVNSWEYSLNMAIEPKDSIFYRCQIMSGSFYSDSSRLERAMLNYPLLTGTFGFGEKSISLVPLDGQDLAKLSHLPEVEAKLPLDIRNLKFAACPENEAPFALAEDKPFNRNLVGRKVDPQLSYGGEIWLNYSPAFVECVRIAAK